MFSCKCCEIFKNSFFYRALLVAASGIHKYSYEMRFPMSTYQGEGTSRGKQFQLNAITSLIWFPFFQIAISLFAYITTFSGQLYFGKSYFFTLFQSNYFDTTVTFSKHLFLQNSYFFLLFQNSHFFARFFFSE